LSKPTMDEYGQRARLGVGLPFTSGFRCIETARQATAALGL
jgi:hypothetical protein